MTAKRSYQNVFKNSSWENDIEKHLTFLTSRISNLDTIFVHLLEKRIITRQEMEKIKNEVTESNKNLELLYTLQRKDWSNVKPIFLQILRETTNDHCANKIESACTNQHSTSSKQTKTGNEKILSRTSLPKPLKNKWWPEEKMLPNSFHRRKSENDELFTEKLKRLLTQNENKTTVINQKVAVSGLGGIGKSVTDAKWFAAEYEKDYDFILWIDCGEGNLLKSFTSLARVLEVKQRRELELKELAVGCFELLKDYKCLFIYDNAECYVGVEGIRSVLPKPDYKFHVIITSRHREWGFESGDGEIPQFQLDVFDKNEAVAFMTKIVETKANHDQSKIESLCELLGKFTFSVTNCWGNVEEK